MRPFSSRLTALLLASVALIPFTACTQRSYNIHQTLRDTRLQAPSGSPKILAVYEPWFGEKNHIDVGYSSQDPAVLQKQINEAKSLGISGFAVDWYGPRQQFTDRSYSLMQDAAARDDFKVGILYNEPVDIPGHETDAVIADLQYAYNRYISEQAGPSRAAYLRFNGRPIIFIFPKSNATDWNRVRQVTNSWADPPLLIYKDRSERYADDFDGFYAWVEPGHQGWERNGKNWGEAYLDDFYRTMRSRYPGKIAVGAAWPGFNDSKASWSLNRYMDQRCGRTFEQSLRVFRRYYDNDQPLPFLLIVTWNDYEEGTAIERGYTTCGSERSQRSASESANGAG
jgi:Glycosyl hydrolase family 99